MNWKSASGAISQGGIDTTPKYTVTFHSKDGTEVSSIIASSGSKITEPIQPAKTNYTFGGWYKESACTNKWNFSADTVTSNITLYARWLDYEVVIDVVDTTNMTTRVLDADSNAFTVKVSGHIAYDDNVFLEQSQADFADAIDDEYRPDPTLLDGTFTALEINLKGILMDLGVENDANIYIAQVNPGLAVYSDYENITESGGVWKKAKSYNLASFDDEFCVLLLAGETATLTVSGGTTARGTILLTITIKTDDLTIERSPIAVRAETLKNYDWLFSVVSTGWDEQTQNWITDMKPLSAKKPGNVDSVVWNSDISYPGGTGAYVITLGGNLVIPKVTNAMGSDASKRNDNNVLMFKFPIPAGVTQVGDTQMGRVARSGDNSPTAGFEGMGNPNNIWINEEKATPALETLDTSSVTFFAILNSDAAKDAAWGASNNGGMRGYYLKMAWSDGTSEVFVIVFPGTGWSTDVTI